ncbi:MAG: DUF58 domain-containing protein [Phycisphaerales bacterium]|nr:DUF58 domain-containing protein [Hyphomonadaceae bacterium]
MSNARLDALNLAGDLPGVLLDAKRLAASAPGVHGRRRAGQGEDFWQYRDHRAEDGARLVDWRRSARGDRFFVREREREAAQTAWFWIDPDAGFNWTSDPQRPTKLHRARTIALATAILLSRGGERIGALGQPPRAGARAVDRLAIDLTAPMREAEAPSNSCIVFFSDFYAPVATWRERLLNCARAGASGALVMIADPAEEDFPFRGRTLFQAPGRGGEVLIGRAEAAQTSYTERLAAQRRDIRALGAELGFPALLHRTDHSASPALSLLLAFVSERYG